MASPIGIPPRTQKKHRIPWTGTRCFPWFYSGWTYGVIVVGVTVICVRFRSFALATRTKVSGVALV